MGSASTFLVCCLLSILLAPSLQQATAGKSKSKEIDFAPEADISTGKDDISPTGNCLEEIGQLCNETKVGESRLADCLSDAIAETETSDSEGSGEHRGCRQLGRWQPSS